MTSALHATNRLHHTDPIHFITYARDLGNAGHPGSASYSLAFMQFYANEGVQREGVIQSKEFSPYICCIAFDHLSFFALLPTI